MYEQKKKLKIILKKMNKTLINILKSREDLSDYLFHFTKNSNAWETLLEITTGKSLKDINKTGVICFTEAPLLSLVKMFEIFEQYENPLYTPYGVAIKKDTIFNLGGRNVIYSLPHEVNLLHDSNKWRFEEFIPNQKDFSWLREWRVPEEKIDLTVDNCFIITKTKQELNSLIFTEENLIDIEFDGCVDDGQFWGTATGIVGRSFKGISLEELSELNAMSKAEINEIIEQQDDDDTGEVGLGGFIM